MNQSRIPFVAFGIFTSVWYNKKVKESHLPGNLFQAAFSQYADHEIPEN
jgi:hypothetical protein